MITLDHFGDYWSVRTDQVTLPLPGGGRLTGGGVLHRGDSRIPTERAVISDGTSYWVWEQSNEPGGAGWAEYDPASGSRGRRSQPAFLTDALRGHPEGSTLPDDFGENWLRPTPTVEGSVLGAPVDGLLGWRAVRVPGQGWHGSDPGGRSVTVPAGNHRLRAALTLPGDERLRSLSSDWRTLTIGDPDGVVTARLDGSHGQAGYSTRSAELPPLSHWFCLRPRDPEGSTALRTVDGATAGALLKAAAEAAKSAELPALVSSALPRVTDPALIGGVVEQLKVAVAQRKALDKVVHDLRPRQDGDRPAARQVRGPSDSLLAAALSGLVGPSNHGYGHYGYGSDSDATHRYLRALAAAVADTAAVAVPGRLHGDVPGLPHSSFPWSGLFLDAPAAVAYRAAVVGTTDAEREALLSLLGEVDALGLGSAEASAGKWRRVLVRLDRVHLTRPDGRERTMRSRAVLPFGGGAVLAVTAEHRESLPDGTEFAALLHDPSGRFEVPAPYTARGASPLGDRERGAGWLSAFLGAAAGRGAAPWGAGAAEEFARLTGVSGPVARLVLAGLPHIDSWDRGFLPAELRTTLGLKAADASYARDDLKNLDIAVRRAVVAALLPADPARLWEDGPDVAAAAAVWNRRVGRRTPVPDWLLTEAVRAVAGTAGSRWRTSEALPALLDPASTPTLSTDVEWAVKEAWISPVEPAEAPFTSSVLSGAMALAAWLAHRLPAGDPVRACLPPALTAVRQRLAAPGLLLGFGHHPTSKTAFLQAAGTPTETGEGYERYGAVVLTGRDEDRARSALRTALLDTSGSDPYLPALRDSGDPSPVETALLAAHDPAFARLLADPGAPVAGSVDKEGTWWPQDPSRSVPELVAEVSEAHGLGADAATLYLQLLAMPDPTDRNTARWTGWKPARLKAARAELAATDLVVTAARSRAGRSLFLPGGWAEMGSPTLPVEQWKLPMYGPVLHGVPLLGVLVPGEPAAELYRRAWVRLREGDVPRFEELKVKRTTRRR